MAERTFRSVLDELDAKAWNSTDKGQSFERLVKAFIQTDKGQSSRFDRVWLWSEWPGNLGRHDIGIDLVARERDSGDLVALQCKFYSPSSTIYMSRISTFLAAVGETAFSSGIIVSTTDSWGKTLDEDILPNRDKPISKWGPDVFENSSVDWQTFDLDNPSVITRRPTKTLREYQEAALDDVLSGFETNHRGKLIMACGSGKTFTTLRIAEQIVGVGGTALFLTPSISLLSQSLIDWANDADLPLKVFAVCSDTHAGQRSEDDEDISPYDLTETPSTNPEQLAARFERANRSQNMTVVFSTYQSLDVVAEAQAGQNGLPEFDLIICDEAHRTTGVSLLDKDESNFRRVHDSGFIAGKKRLYMTATPRIFGDRARRRANESNLTAAVASMDDESIYGPDFHWLSFGQAVDKDILTPYKVIILNVDQEQVGIDLNKLLSDNQSDVNMDNGARMIGCWNGLGKRAAGIDFEQDPQSAKRAVAFSNRIKDSESFAKSFPTVIDTAIDVRDNPENTLRCAVRHVDGTQNALERADHLAWLRAEPEPGTCRVLSNSRCLTEGIDVAALDAILFLDPRKSDIDVVQAVGRVMRKQEGKKFGYIILPIAQAPGVTDEESLNSSAYRAVWQVINAISAHDDRFEAIINQFALSRQTSTPTRPDYAQGGDISHTNGVETLTPEERAIQGILQIAGTPELRDAILAKVVDKYADPTYWEKWAATIRQIAQRHEARIRALLNTPEAGVQPVFDDFLKAIRNDLNDDIDEEDAIGMLSQHLITRPVFDALFEDYDFAEQNPVSQAMQETIDALADRGLDKETTDLENFYRDVRIRAQGVADAAGKQSIIAELYQRFFKLALPDTAARLGIVYTPVEVVDYMIRSVENVLNHEFNASVSDQGVHILDPFVGTGTFITRLMRSGLIRPEDLRRKYEDELHANDIMLLAYYVAAINIESTYHDMADSDEYRPFNGIVLTDTFQSYEEADPMDEFLFPRNNERIERQKGLDIRVIVGNPPWSASNNRKYATIDQQVQQRYAAPSATKHLSALYDPYVKAIRLASDRIQNSENGGIVAFVTNGGFIDSNAFDGFRKAVTEEFHAVYCFNLRGDARTSGDKRQRERGGVFNQESRAGVAILLLVKKPGESPGATIYYRDIGDYLEKDAKLAVLRDSRLSDTDWTIIEPNDAGDWINQRSEAFIALRPLSPPEENSEGNDLEPIFLEETLGLQTGRDAWCYNSSLQKLRGNIQSSIAFYNQQVDDFIKTAPSGSAQQKNEKAKSFAKKDPSQFHWREEVYRDLANGKKFEWIEEEFVESTYRPFNRQHLYFSSNLNCRIRRFPQIYPQRDAENIGICIVDKGAGIPFHALATDCIPDAHLTGDSIYFPRWRFVMPKELLKGPKASEVDLERVSNINPAALAQFQEHYGDPEISEDDLFYYTYGILHSQQWREKFADDLAKTAVRIPMAATADDFHAFAVAGLELADLHVNYETVEPYPLFENHPPDWDPETPNVYRVEKMAYAGPARNPDKSAIVCNAHITLTGIPEAAHHYRLGSRSALDWLIDRFQVTTHKASGIINDPNDWATEHGNPQYIIDLIKRITTVSVKTVKIVQGLPALPPKDTNATEARPPQKWEFEILADEWIRERPRRADVAAMAKHPAYQQIIEMGDPAVGWLLGKLAEKPDHWFPALNRITGATPVPEQSQGKLEAMTEAWLSWGKANGYEW